MFTNWQTVLVAAVVAAVLVAIIVVAVMNRRKGKRFCSCGSSCGGCAFSDTCHKQ